jgi:predicted porin
MKKSILAIAVASMAASSAAMAEPTVYGNIHITLHEFDNAYTNGPNLTSHTSSIGVKGSEDLGDGWKAIYKAEFQLDATDDQGGGNALTQRDVFAGLKAGFGTLKLGIMSSNYKQMGGKVDALYRTPAEGRGFIHTQSRLHGGRGDTRGRQTNTVQYVSPKFGGVELVANTTFNDNADESTGVGVRWSNKSILVYADYIDTVPGGDSVSVNATESAVKVGGKFDADMFFVGAQYEAAEDVTGYDYIHVNAGFLIDKNNIITATYGTASHIQNDFMDTTGMAIAYDHKMSKMTDVYVAYMDKSSDDTVKEDSAWALGIRKKF